MLQQDDGSEPPRKYARLEDAPDDALLALPMEVDDAAVAHGSDRSAAAQGDGRKRARSLQDDEGPVPRRRRDGTVLGDEAMAVDEDGADDRPDNQQLVRRKKKK